MSDANLIEPPKNEISVEFSGLSVEERNDLEAFLKAQPEVQTLGRRYRMLDHALGQDLGFLTGSVYHFVVGVGTGLARSVVAAAILERIKVRFPPKKTEAKPLDEDEPDDQEYEWVLRWEGNIVRAVKRPSR